MVLILQWFDSFAICKVNPQPHSFKRQNRQFRAEMVMFSP